MMSDDLTTVYVGAKRRFKSISDALYFYGSRNLKIYVDTGDYNETVCLRNTKNIQIIGNTRVNLYSTNDIIIVESSKNILIKNVIIGYYDKTSPTGLLISKSENISITDSIIHTCNVAVSVAKDSLDVSIKNNFISATNIAVQIFNTSLELHNNTIMSHIVGCELINSHVLMEKNFFINTMPVKRSEESTINVLDNIYIADPIIRYQEFIKIDTPLENSTNGDYRFRDKKYQTFGASENILLKYATIHSAKEFNSDDEAIIRPITKIEKLTLSFNLSLPNLKDKYSLFFEEKFKQWKTDNITFQFGGKFTINPEYVLFINALDSTEDIDEINLQIQYCHNNKIPYLLYFLSNDKFNLSPNHINLGKIGLIMSLHQELKAKYADKVVTYDSLEHLAELVYKVYKQAMPIIKLQRLKLSNIGCFQQIDVSLDEHFTAFIGVNGCGKTTLLRAILLALIGQNHKGISKRVHNLLRIQGINNNNILRKKGKIQLTYRIANKEYTNNISIVPDEEQNINIIDDGVLASINGHYLKSLIVAFSQNRGMHLDKHSMSDNIIHHPHVNDVLPLLNNETDLRIKRFSKWIVDLDAQANKASYKIIKEKKDNIGSDVYIKERELITSIFKIFSKISDAPVAFKEVLNNNDVWITTPFNPEGISLHLTSQGYQSIFAWLGHFIQRLSEAYPNDKNFMEKPAICLVDELDTYLHPKLQANLINTLKNDFPNTQFIITTHSPQILNHLTATNIIQLAISEDNLIKAEISPINAYGAKSDRVLEEIMGGHDRPLEIKKQLHEYFRLIDDNQLDEAKKLGKQLKAQLDPEDPELLKADVLVETKGLFNN